MHTLPPELYHSQIVGQMSYITVLLRQIDPDEQHELIRNEHKEEIYWIKEVNDFQKIWDASAKGQCPGYDSLSKKALVLQELNRLIIEVQPFTMSKEVIESMYADLKKSPNLWTSFYHSRLNELEQLTQAVKNMQAPAQCVLQAAVAKLQQHLSVKGLVQPDAKADRLFKFALQMR